MKTDLIKRLQLVVLTVMVTEDTGTDSGPASSSKM